MLYEAVRKYTYTFCTLPYVYYISQQRKLELAGKPEKKKSSKKF
jgi:hypothetical protein